MRELYNHTGYLKPVIPLLLPLLNRLKSSKSIRQVGIFCQQQSQLTCPHPINSRFDVVFKVKVLLYRFL